MKVGMHMRNNIYIYAFHFMNIGEDWLVYRLNEVLVGSCYPILSFMCNVL